MARILLFALSLLFSLAIHAASIQRSEALQIARNFMPQKHFNNLKAFSPRKKIQGSKEAFYVFNADDGGFVIVSGDDRTPEVLGYSLSGNIDMDDLPDNMKWWLDSYVRQIEALGSGLQPLSKSRNLNVKSAIKPLIKTTWNQYEPYNLQCPIRGEEHCLTGCVATAMAQIMYYWRWPSSCPALPAYSYADALPSTTFRWNYMQKSYISDSYGKNYNQRDAQAVAELMRYCGQAVGMQYGLDGSGAWLNPVVLVDTFQYSKSIHSIKRDDYTTSHWESIIYQELSNERPVLYGGESGKGGHQFIIDGYDGNGLFHINWGWGGYQDNYFVLSIADPDQPGSSIIPSSEAYKSKQSALIGVMPATDDETMLPLISSNSLYSGSNAYTRSSTSENFQDVTFTGRSLVYYTIPPTGELNVQVGLALYQDEQMVYLIGYNQQTLQSSQRFTISNNLTASFGKDIPTGKYQIYQVYKFDGDNEWIRCGGYEGKMLWADINDISLSIQEASSSGETFTVNSLSTSAMPSVGNPVNIKMNITNTGNTKSVNVYLWLQNEGQTTWNRVATNNWYVDPNTSSDIIMTFTPNKSGTYTLKVTGTNSDEVLWTTTIIVSKIVEVVQEGIKYQCMPTYEVAKVLFNKDTQNTLSTVVIPETVTAEGKQCRVVEIDDEAFYNCGSIQEVIVPEGVETIGERAFAYCWNLKKIELPGTITSLGDYLVTGNSSLETVVSHQKEPIDIEDNVFVYRQWNEELQQYEYLNSTATLYVPIGSKEKYEAIDGWTKFARIEEGEYAETFVDNLKYGYATGGSSAILLQDNSYKQLKEVNIQSSISINGKEYQVKHIDNRAFYNCGNIQEVIVPEGVETIGDMAFAYCWDLKKIELPGTITSLGDYLVTGNSSLETVVSHQKEPIDIEDNVFVYRQWDEDLQQYEDINSTATLYVPIGSKAKYEAIAGWTKFAKIEEGEYVESFVDNLKYGYATGESTATLLQDESYQQLTEVNIPSSISINGKEYQVKHIDNIAFYNCGSIQEVIVPEGVETIGDMAFAYCWDLKKIELPSTITSLGYYLVTTKLEKVVSHQKEPIIIKDDVFVYRQWDEDLQQYEDLNSTATLYVPIGSKEKYEAIDGWTKFARIEEGEYAETFVDNLKYGYATGGSSAILLQDNSYKQLKEVNIPSKVNINGRVYQVTDFQNEVFYNCSYIKRIVVPEGIETIGYYAFAYCWDLTSLVLPKSLKHIGSHSILRNKRLTEVISFNDTPLPVDDITFVYESQWNSETRQYDLTATSAILYVPKGKIQTYANTTGWNWFADIREITDEITSTEAIISTTDNSNNVVIYSLDGKRMSNPQRGLNLLRMSDGTTKKIFLK